MNIKIHKTLSSLPKTLPFAFFNLIYLNQAVAIKLHTDPQRLTTTQIPPLWPSGGKSCTYSHIHANFE